MIGHKWSYLLLEESWAVFPEEEWSSPVLVTKLFASSSQLFRFPFAKKYLCYQHLLHTKKGCDGRLEGWTVQTAAPAPGGQRPGAQRDLVWELVESHPRSQQHARTVSTSDRLWAILSWAPALPDCFLTVQTWAEQLPGSSQEENFLHLTWSWMCWNVFRSSLSPSGVVRTGNTPGYFGSENAPLCRLEFFLVILLAPFLVSRKSCRFPGAP